MMKRKNASESWTLLKALADWLTSPKVICPAKSRGACTTSGSGVMIWVIARFQPSSAKLRDT